MTSFDSDNQTEIGIAFDSDGTEIGVSVNTDTDDALTQIDVADVPAVVSDFVDAYALRGGDVVKLLADLIDSRDVKITDVMDALEETLDWAAFSPKEPTIAHRAEVSAAAAGGSGILIDGVTFPWYVGNEVTVTHDVKGFTVLILPVVVQGPVCLG